MVPGPGHYNIKSNFDSIKYLKSMDDSGNYLENKNGHLNQKRQIYNKYDQYKMQINQESSTNTSQR